MTGPNPDRVPLSVRRRKCETVRAMRDEHWDVLAKCDACGLVMRVDLKLIMRVRGPDVSLWNRRSRCRRVGCSGWMDFQARAPGMAGTKCCGRSEATSSDPSAPASKASPNAAPG